MRQYLRGCGPTIITVKKKGIYWDAWKIVYIMMIIDILYMILYNKYCLYIIFFILFATSAHKSIIKKKKKNHFLKIIF